MSTHKSNSRKSSNKPTSLERTLNAHWVVVSDHTSSPDAVVASANKMFEMGSAITVPAERVLGRGENGITLETNDHRAVKIVRHDTKEGRQQLLNETTYQKELSLLEIAPAVYADEIVSNYSFILMSKVEPIDVLTATQPFIKKLIKLIAKMVYHGYIHNDIHWGNVARRIGARNEPILIDFGFTQKLERAPDMLSFNQILMAQLYSLTDACNVNNCMSGDCLRTICDDEPIGTIYQLRQGQTSIYENLANEGISYRGSSRRTRRVLTIREPAIFTRRKRRKARPRFTSSFF